ncbi:hypothetical protein CGRA01v4_11014 [Colletotrichum graminicola]|uniref:Uncharacterized protein n=1 Tax=Colletotrichum graminicola (strain M1.001 / M2 / FGSC 10212) TaxID=645133 RepID=E3QKQ1_COLGM|nr:uncharacterized protein GLRG_06583 [Colletotrichum graminicola M1.001]EFQ31439.1 hypothetical protein GLRG_06583 [Colletotrichum graminicola M1.001]WDK19727.1 hypothetical protein CGRA01v4_11014 [Colletotrichum graminicola]
MQRPGATPVSANTPFFSSSFFSSSSKSRPGTSSGEQQQQQQPQQLQPQSQIPQPQLSPFFPPPSGPNVLLKDRKNSFARKTSFSSPSKSKRRASSSGGGGNVVVTDRNVPPALPDFALAAAAKITRETDNIQSPASTDSFTRMLGRTQTGSMSLAPSDRLQPPPSATHPNMWQSSESVVLHMQMLEMANKRISTLDYLRKAHEGRVYWFNTILFDKPDLARMPSYESRKLARRATNYLLLGLSLPTIVDLYANTPIEFLRSLNNLLQEFESFQQLHSEGGSSTSSLSRARLPSMFRRQAGKSRRSASGANDIGYPADSDPASGGSYGGIGGSSSASASVMSFASSDNDLLPGEVYTHLLTPSLPFEPDFYETFATLCEVLIDVYTKILALVPTPRETSTPIAELFAKADAKVRKIIVQGVVKEFEDNSRTHIKTEMGNIGKVVLGGLM